MNSNIPDANIHPLLRDSDASSIVVRSDTCPRDSHAAPAPVESPLTASSGPTPAPAAGAAPSYGQPQTPQTPVGTAAHALSDHEHDHDYDSSIHAATGSAPHDPNDPKRPRACEACRGLKVKCEPDPGNPDGPCKRCAKAGRGCIVTQPTRKRQKKTDSRVAELEKKIDALTASLQASRGGPTPGQPSTEDQSELSSLRQPTVGTAWVGPPPRESQPAVAPDTDKPPLPSAGQKRKHSETTNGASERHPAWPATSAPTPAKKAPESTPDMIDRGLVTVQQANEFFARYNEDMIKHLPAVVFPPGTTAADIRRSKPLLFLAVMAAASSEMPNIQRQLVKELVQMFADNIVINGQKSLELVQALQVGVIWYHPPEHFEELKFYQFVHMGAVMAMDIGLGRKRNSAKQRLIPYTWKDHPLRKNPLPDPSTVECRRAWLSCYFLASNVAMALHRPNLIRWTSFMTECIDILESSPEALPSDRYLCHLVWSHRLAEEVGIQFSLDDPGAYVNVAEPKVQYALRGFERDLEKYSESIPPAEKQPSLEMSFHVLSLYMHEIALYVDKAEDGRPPFNVDTFRDPVPGLNESLTAAHIGALSACLTAIDGIFETFLSMDVHSIRCLPVFNFVRVAYAVVVLIKMYFSASSPNSELGKVINKDHMKVEEYLDRLLEKFREVGAAERSRPASKFLLVLLMIRSWFQKQGKLGEQNPPSLPQNNSSSSDSAASKVESHGSTPPQQQLQPQPQSQQPLPPQQANTEYNPANTPLQLLSEIATGNRGGNSEQSVSSAAVNTNGFPAWVQGGQPFVYDATAGVPTSGVGLDVPGMGPYLSNPLATDFDYTNISDGFEQAMGLTFGGYGAEWNPHDPDTMRYFMGEGIIGMNGLFPYQ